MASLVYNDLSISIDLVVGEDIISFIRDMVVDGYQLRDHVDIEGLEGAMYRPSVFTHLDAKSGKTPEIVMELLERFTSSAAGFKYDRAVFVKLIGLNVMNELNSMFLLLYMNLNNQGDGYVGS